MHDTSVSASIKNILLAGLTSALATMSSASVHGFIFSAQTFFSLLQVDPILLTRYLKRPGFFGINRVYRLLIGSPKRQIYFTAVLAKRYVYLREKACGPFQRPHFPENTHDFPPLQLARTSRPRYLAVIIFIRSNNHIACTTFILTV